MHNLAVSAAPNQRARAVAISPEYGAHRNGSACNNDWDQDVVERVFGRQPSRLFERRHFGLDDSFPESSRRTQSAQRHPLLAADLNRNLFVRSVQIECELKQPIHLRCQCDHSGFHWLSVAA